MRIEFKYDVHELFHQILIILKNLSSLNYRRRKTINSQQFDQISIICHISYVRKNSKNVLQKFSNLHIIAKTFSSLHVFHRKHLFILFYFYYFNKSCIFFLIF